MVERYRRDEREQLESRKLVHPLGSRQEEQAEGQRRQLGPQLKERLGQFEELWRWQGRRQLDLRFEGR